MTIALVIGLSQVSGAGALKWQMPAVGTASSESEPSGEDRWSGPGWQGPADLSGPQASGNRIGLRSRVAAGPSDQARVSTAPVKCHARGAVRFYSRRLAEHRAKMGARVRVPAQAARVAETSATSCPRYHAAVLKRKARAWRLRAERWVSERTLRDFPVRPGNHAWLRAVDEVQRAYPGTKGWLTSCSASEGGHGRCVVNEVGCRCWMQFVPSTFWRMFAAARSDLRARGFRIPSSAASTDSPLGQALAGAWGRTNGRSHEWFGSGC